MKDNYLSSLAALAKVAGSMNKPKEPLKEEPKVLAEDLENLEEAGPNMKGIPTGVKLKKMQIAQREDGTSFKASNKDGTLGMIYMNYEKGLGSEIKSVDAVSEYVKQRKNFGNLKDAISYLNQYHATPVKD